MRRVRLGLLAVALMATGCGLFNSSNPNTPLIADMRSPISDVPVPAGFTMTSDSTSKVVPGDSIRFVDHRYKGSDDLLPVVNFYKAQLPERQWTLVDQSQASGNEVSLHFKKNNEDCVVTVTKRTLDTQIHIRVDPVGRNAAK